MSSLAYWEGLPPENPIVRFYAIAILLGAFLALFLSSYRAHKDGYDWSFFGTIFIVAFPCGIIGARIWYVIADWNPAWNFWDIFAIWNGGLAIQGGAIGGVLAGALVAFFCRKGTPLLKCTDFAVPTILVAQAVGRWGNFFNQEVFGHTVTLEAWNFLPSFITNNMQNGSSAMGWTGVVIPEGSIAAPLFLVEGILNVAFFFLITYGLESLEGKHYKLGDSTFAYFIAYGFTRLILEPMRNAAFQMGVNNHADGGAMASYGMAIAFIAVGAFLIFMNHLLRYLDNRKHVFDNIPYVNKALVYLKRRAGEVEEVDVHKQEEIDLSALERYKDDHGQKK